MNLFFDLDGTLTDPGVGITRCIQHAIVGLGGEPPPVEALMKYVGPPLQATFRELLETPSSERVDAAIALYRERFVTVGLFENQPYPGIGEALGALKDAGHRLWVVTAKPHLHASRILEHFGLSAHFQRVYGPELTGLHGEKADLIRHILEVEPIEGQRPWMIGDRSYDVDAAHQNGLSALGVLWGYGSREELSGADALAESLDDLLAWSRRSP